jgi:hypothetical protein
VSDAIDKDSGRMYSAGHAFCKAVDDAEGDVTIGYSSASKVWSSAYKDLKDYIQWCDGLGKKIANKDIKSMLVDYKNTRKSSCPISFITPSYFETVMDE